MKLTKRKGIFYGWWIVIAGTLVSGLNGGLYFYGFSVFFTPLMKEFGWSATVLSGAFSVSRLQDGIAGPLVGFLIDRFGPRKLMFFGFIMAGGGFILLAQVNSIEMFYVVFVAIMSVGVSLAFSAPANATVASWFIRKRTLAMGVMTCGIGFGGFLVPVVAWFISQYGWRTAAVFSGVLFVAVGIPVSLVMRHKPEHYGYLPDGDSPSPSAGKGQDSPDEGRGRAPASKSRVDEPKAMEAGTEVDFSPRQALATSTFWFLALVYLLRQLVVHGVVIHQIPALQRMGYSPEVAASMLAVTTILSIPGRLGFGWLGDRWDKRYVTAICLGLQFLGLAAFAYANDLFLIIVFLILYSPAYGGLVPLGPATWGEYFGRRRFATISGLSQGISMWGTIAGPVLAGYTFDVSGSYQFAFTFFAVTNLVAIMFLFFVRRPKAKHATVLLSEG